MAVFRLTLLMICSLHEMYSMERFKTPVPSNFSKFADTNREIRELTDLHEFGKDRIFRKE